MTDELCGCGKPTRYETPTGMACNKYMRCLLPGVQAAIDAALDKVARDMEMRYLSFGMAALVRSYIGTNPLAACGESSDRRERC